ncbi:MAG: trigger factor [Lachnospiraceae bacterium]|nr:trigger factor [Lachnospiraceae bacterium]
MDEDLLKETADKAEDAVSGAVDGVTEAAEETAGKAAEVAEAANVKITETATEAAEAVNEGITETVAVAAEAASEEVTEAVAVAEAASEEITETAAETVETVKEETLRTVTETTDTVNEGVFDSGRVIEKASARTTAVLISIIVVLVALIVIFGVIIFKQYFDKKDTQIEPDNSRTEVTAVPVAEEEITDNTDNTDVQQPVKEYDVTVELGQYKGLEIDFPEINITEEEIDDMVDEFVEDLAEEVPVGRPAENGDNMNIDYVGYMDGEEFEGGKDEDVDLVLGDGHFFDAFEEGLVGKDLGEHTLELNFPDDYYEDLAGKPVTFVVTINSITQTEIPELSDELVAENTEYSTIAEYRAYIKGELEEEAREEAEDRINRDILYMAIDNATFGGEIDEEINDLALQYFNYYDQMAQAYYGMTGAQMFNSFYGMSEADYDATIREESSYSVKAQRLLDKVADAENIAYTEEEYKTEFEEIFFSYYGFTEEAEVKEQLSDEEIDKIVISSIKQRKAQDLIIDNAVIHR